MLEDRIKSARKLAGLSQRVIAEEIGVSQATISLWERGRLKPPDSTRLALIASACGVKLSYFSRARTVAMGKLHNHAGPEA